MRSSTLDRLTKDVAGRLEAQVREDWSILKPIFLAELSPDERRQFRAMAGSVTSEGVTAADCSAFFAAMRPVVDRAGIGGQFDKFMELLIQADRLAGE